MKDSIFASRLRSACLLVCVLALASIAEARPLKLFTIGNSFSENATQFLPELAKAGGHELILGAAQRGSCSLEEHWGAVEAHLANPRDSKAKIYGDKSLSELIGANTWDVITIQQYSVLSGDPATYAPFGEKLAAYLKKIQPQAEIVIHQTWPYRKDAQPFGFIGTQQHALDEQQMWEKSRAAYRLLARQLNARVLPVGDAFWSVDSDPNLGFKADPSFNEDEAAARFPVLPAQPHSLHIGYFWQQTNNGQHRLGSDTHHANDAGKYLAALVWYGVLFHESPEKVAFVPSGMDAEFAAQLRRVAARTVAVAGAIE